MRRLWRVMTLKVLTFLGIEKDESPWTQRAMKEAEQQMRGTIGALNRRLGVQDQIDKADWRVE